MRIIELRVYDNLSCLVDIAPLALDADCRQTFIKITPIVELRVYDNLSCLVDIAPEVPLVDFD